MNMIHEHTFCVKGFKNIIFGLITNGNLIPFSLVSSVRKTENETPAASTLVQEAFCYCNCRQMVIAFKVDSIYTIIK
jgi:hypothetical protein